LSVWSPLESILDASLAMAPPAQPNCFIDQFAELCSKPGRQPLIKSTKGDMSAQASGCKKATCRDSDLFFDFDLGSTSPAAFGKDRDLDAFPDPLDRGRELPELISSPDQSTVNGVSAPYIFIELKKENIHFGGLNKNYSTTLTI
jgi:hypothetical protein